MVPGSTAGRGTLALIGGGRWARVFASVLASLKLPFGSIVIVSQSGALTRTEEGSADPLAGLTILPDIEAALDCFQIGAAIIANAARAHVASADALIGAGVPVLIEKPAALTVAQAQHLIGLADAHGVCVVPSLSFLHTSYLRRFAALIRSKGALRHVTLEWRDPVGEVRHGERKSYDPGISIAQDVMPHIWSILSVTIGMRPDDVEARACQIAKGGSSARYELDAGGVPCLVTLERDAPVRRRHLSVETTSGDHLAIDFTVEPGTIMSGATAESGDPRWAERPRPLTGQIGDFLAARNGRTSEAATRALLGSVALAERCDVLLKQRQREWASPAREVGELHYALRDLLGGHFYEQGLGRPGDAPTLDMWVEGRVRQFRSGEAGADVDYLLRTSP